MSPENSVLDVAELEVSYGHVHVLQGVSFEIGVEPLGMVGRNGMGKSTLAKALVGFLPARSGSVQLHGVELLGCSPQRINRLGVGYVPQGRRVFPSLSVQEHLTMVRSRADSGWTPERVFELFPRLAERRRNGGAELSGGEQQMLAIGRALLTNPELLVMDEPSEGLAPAVVEHLAGVFRDLVAEGQAILLIEQNLRFAAEVCDRMLVMVNGRIAADVPTERIVHDTEMQNRYLGVV